MLKILFFACLVALGIHFYPRTSAGTPDHLAALNQVHAAVQAARAAPEPAAVIPPLAEAGHFTGRRIRLVEFDAAGRQIN